MCFRTGQTQHKVTVGTLLATISTAYRLSLSWSRLLPKGRGEVNEDGLRFYNAVINALIERGITPWVTLYHWDLPSQLEQNYNGWLGPKEKIVEDFGNFAKLAFVEFGDRVKHWVTINEPWCAAVLGYCTGVHAPGRKVNPATEPYVAAHNMLLCHAEAARIYRELDNTLNNGQLGMALNAEWREPCEPQSKRDVAACQRSMDWQLGWFADPVHFGDYPHSMRQTLKSRLPSFTLKERNLLKGSCDFFGINYYTTTLGVGPRRGLVDDASNTADCLPTETNLCAEPGPGGYFDDVNVNTPADPNWVKTDMGWSIVPWGLRKLLGFIHKRYHPKAGIVITENGAALEPKHRPQTARTGKCGSISTWNTREEGLAALVADCA